MAIDGLICERQVVDHEDERRALITIFNGDLEHFVAKHIRIIKMHRDAILGGHYHDYRELFYMLEGEATFYLKDIQTGETESYFLYNTDMILIPKLVAHKVSARKGSILIGCAEEVYLSRESNDCKYDF